MKAQLHLRMHKLKGMLIVLQRNQLGIQAVEISAPFSVPASFSLLLAQLVGQVLQSAVLSHLPAG